ncbi:MAG: DUF1565 domain-containing protein [Cyanobacteria bacterium RM1_2_2]|nr:DUF1565 domain-containing protein [Cyanobacteria bacterium RM1_2_2]
MMQRQVPIELYVNAAKGDDTASGTSLAPYKTLTHALKTAKPNSIIYLSRGSYTTENGEQFPLVIANSLSIVGNVAAQGSGVLLQGSGIYESLSFGQQSVTVVLEGEAQLRGVTVTNFDPKGTGIWLESATPTLSNCTLAACCREGVLVTGTANPVISDCLFRENAASGLTLVRHARGELRNNVCRQNGFGIAISDRAAPVLVSNQIFENRCGVVLSGAAAPILRGNVLTQNTEDGLAVFAQASPDLGTHTEPAGNRIRQNQRFDLRNATAQTVISSGNQLNPIKVSGSVEWLAISSPYTQPPVAEVAKLERGSSAYRSPLHAPGDLINHEFAALIQPLLDRQILSLTSNQQFDPQGWLIAAELGAWMQKAGLNWDGAHNDSSPPVRPLTRLQATEAVVQAANLTGGHPKLLSQYADRGQVPSAQTLIIATALQHRLLVWATAQDRLNLLHPITRAEAGAVLYQALVAKGEAVAVEMPIASPVKPIRLPASSPRRAPVVVLDPGHGGSDTGVVTQVKSADDEMQLPADSWMMDRAAEVALSPLPAGMMEPAMMEPMGMPMGMPMPAEMPLGMEPPEPASMPRMPDDPPAMPSLREKEVVLSIAQAVASFLKQQGIQVVMTRADDRDMTPAERVEIAERSQADAFISIHANASIANQSAINGIETYYNSDLPAGSQLAWAIHKALTRMPDVEDRGVHSATFYTLRSHSIAAAHVEVGYITGSKDAPSLGNSAYHRYLARSIANGIGRYVQQKGN